MTLSFLFTSSLDPAITYVGDWKTADGGSFTTLGNLGSPLGSALRGLSAANGNFSYSFHGSSINVFGTVLVNDSASQNPVWACFVDGVSLGPPSYPNISVNNWPLCQHALPDGSHELTVGVSSTVTPFYFDYLLYTPSTNIPLENATIYVDNTDTSIVYDSTWSPDQGGNATSSPGGEVTISFVGRSLDYYGFIPSGSASKPSSAEYSVDGQSFTSFTLGGSASDLHVDLFNQKLFSTGPLKQDSHTLTVRNNGDSSVTPLTFDFALVSYVATSSSGNPNSNSTHSQNQPDLPPLGLLTHHGKNKLPAIIGGAAGGAVVVIVLALSLMFMVRRRRRRRRKIQLEEDKETETQRANMISPLPVSHFTQSSLSPSMPTATAPQSITSTTQPSSEILSSPPLKPVRKPTVAMSIISAGSTSTSSRTNTTKASAVMNSGPLAYGAGHYPQPNTQDTSANEITPMLPEEDEGSDFEAPPPTYTSRPDVVSSEKLIRYFMRRNK